ncbi:MAG: Rrf2 family transcriptional regulator, iron-sulfur cluster assembly transcription factor [Desulfomicrobiaceae bacterium]|nr:Rrf2 family transcriptional regulator, iron-sulfur cluster assembly transcription factor [Desulfomicrobiaceae bacterium]
MKLSARSRYATRILIDIALHDHEAPVNTTSISERTGISVQFIEQILKSLKAASLVISKRGAAGGYQLSRPADTITLGDIIRIMEGPIALTDCCSNAQVCTRSDFCMTRDAWVHVSEVVANALDSLKLTDLIQGIHPACPDEPDSPEPSPSTCA